MNNINKQPKIAIIEQVIYQALSDKKTRNRATEVVSLYRSNDEAEKAEWRVYANAIASRLHDTLGIGAKGEPKKKAHWHIRLHSIDPDTDDVACGYKSNFMPIADYPFQVTCPVCERICEILLERGNPENWPVGEDEEKAKKDYLKVCANPELYGYQ